MSRHMIISFSRDDVHGSLPWPIGLEERPVRGMKDMTQWRVTSGLGDDDGAILVGFGPVGKQHVSVFPETAVEDPAQVAGLSATFSTNDQFFEWSIPLKELEVR